MQRLWKLFMATLILPMLASAAETQRDLALFYVFDKNVEEAYNRLVEEEITKIGYVMADPHHRVNDQYEAKYGSTRLDVLSFLPAVNDTLVMKLFNTDPRLAGFSPFNMLIYKKKNEDKTYVGHLLPEAMLDILGITDETVRQPFIDSVHKLDALMVDYFKEKGLTYTLKRIPYDNPTSRKMFNFEYTFDEPDDIDDFIETFQNRFELAFIDKGYLIAGFHNFMDADDSEELLADFDAFWSYSLCHLKYSYNVFDNDRRPDAGLFAPCTMYIYIKKGSHKIVLGMPTLDNVKNTLKIKNREALKWIDKLQEEIPQILREFGMVAVENTNPLTTAPKPLSVTQTDTKQRVSKPVKRSKNEPSNSVSRQENNGTVAIVIPKPVTPDAVPQPPKVEVIGGSSTKLRTIQFSKRYPPGYIPLEERIAKRFSAVKSSTNTLGEINAGRIATYLRGPYISVDEAKTALEKAGFRILAVMPLTKKKKHTIIVFTGDELAKFAAEHNAEFLADLRLHIDDEHKQISITNPLYLAKAFMGDNFDDTLPKTLLRTLTKTFKGLKNSKEVLKFDALPHYKFMNGMPEFKDTVEVAIGDNLAKKLENNKQVVFVQKLPNGTVLAGIKFKRRTQKFPYRIGTQNAALLPYPVLVKNNKAYIMDPKYYIAVMYPLLKMSEFMTIATVPDAIVKEAQRIFR